MYGLPILYRGLPTPYNIGRYTRVPVTLETLALLVRGLPPTPTGAARGAVRAAKWVVGKKAGRYDMADVLGIER